MQRDTERSDPLVHSTPRTLHAATVATMPSDTLADLEFVCPRCQRAASETFYGPCHECRTELRSVFAGEAREIEVVAYEPKMNVVPNQIASKE
jgi:hypothetical protein